MTFSKEDRAAWADSEIMKEFEKIAKENDILNGPPSEAYEPIEKEEKDWEDEDMVDFEEALENFEEGPSFEEEMHMAYNKNLFSNLEKIASDFANKSNIKVAYKIELILHKLKKYFEVKNG